jgi:hypothetical protein
MKTTNGNTQNRQPYTDLESDSPALFALIHRFARAPVARMA